ncbi:VOC family protein [Streptomyces sp. NPDC056112]|uniref:VOC family protein n=1 Tax=unclassified Streptomyces TaxID=2593676 RepID=UPI001CD1BD62|nr:VOC family protein [Streptomyces sp. CoT10]
MTEAPEPGVPNGRAPARNRPGTPCRVSLMAHGLAAAQAFYGELFGWEFQPGPSRLGPCVRVLLNGREVGGVGQLPPGRRLPVAWTPYLASDDVDLTAETVRLCGGTIGVGPLDAGGIGRLTIGSDPWGAVFGLLRARSHPGAETTGLPGAPVWHELLTYETTGVATFYSRLFGYERKPDGSAGVDRVTLHLDGRPVAGVHGVGRALPHDRGPHWMTYFEVTDTDEATEHLVALGGRILTPTRDTALGRVATVADPEGARFALIQGSR